MNLHLIFVMLINAAELAATNTMFSYKFERRHNFGLRLFCCIAIALGYIFLYPINTLSFLVVHIPIIIMGFMYIKLCYKTSWIQMVYIGTVGYTVKHISSLINSIITIFFPEEFGHLEEQYVPVNEINYAGYGLIISVDIVVFVIAYNFLSKKIRKADIQKQATFPMSVLGVVVLVMNQLWSVGIVLTGKGYAISFNSGIEYVWNLLFCILVLAVQLNIITIGEKNKELEIINKLIEDKEQQYKISKASTDSVKKKCHDLKYEIAAIAMGIDSETHAQTAMEMLRSFDSDIKTGNTPLDIVFNEKNFYCKNHDIVFTPMIDGQSLDIIKASDLYIMFSELIDRAILNVRNIANHAKRYIYVNVFPQNQFLLIQVEYPIDLDKTYTYGDINKKLKEKTINYDLSSVKFVVDKYDGSINVKVNEDIFMLNIIIPLRENVEK